MLNLAVLFKRLSRSPSEEARAKIVSALFDLLSTPVDDPETTFRCELVHRGFSGLCCVTLLSPARRRSQMSNVTCHIARCRRATPAITNKFRMYRVKHWLTALVGICLFPTFSWSEHSCSQLQSLFISHRAIVEHPAPRSLGSALIAPSGSLHVDVC